MGKLIKCHFYYLINPLTIIIFIITILGVLFFSLFSSLSIDNRMNISMQSSYYYSSMFEIIKLISFVLVIILFGYSFTTVNDSYHAIVISNKINRSIYFISKIILLYIVFVFIYLINITITIVIGLLFHIVLTPLMLKSLFHLFLVLMIYGNYSLILILLLDNIYIIFILFPLSLITYTKDIYFLSFFLPILVNNDLTSGVYLLVQPSWYYIFWFAIQNMIMLFIFNKKDLLN